MNANNNNNYHSIGYKTPQPFHSKTTKKEHVDLQNRFIASIKKLNQFVDVQEVYEDVEEIVDEIQTKDVNVYQKYMMYVYKWIVGSKGRVEGEVEEQGNELREVIQEKLISGQASPEE